MNRTNRYKRYAGESGNETGYSSDEGNQKLYVRPVRRRYVKVIPTKPVIVHRINEDTDGNKMLILVKRKPKDARVVHPSPRYVKVDSFRRDTDDIESDYSRIDSKRLVPIFRAEHSNDKYTTTKPKRVLLLRKSYPQSRIRHRDKPEHEKILIPARKVHVPKSLSEKHTGVTRIIPVERLKLVRSLSNNERISPTGDTIAIRRKQPSISYSYSDESTEADSVYGSGTSTDSVYGSGTSIDSVYSSSTSIDSYDSDDSTGSSSSSYSESSSLSNQTGRLLLDYSKLLKSKDDQKRYEKERKNFEHERHIVTLVQKEVNKPIQSEKRQQSEVSSKSKSVAEQSFESKIQQKELKPLSKNTKEKENPVGHSRENEIPLNEPKPLRRSKKSNENFLETQEIKRKVQEEQGYLRLTKKRNQVVVWVETDYKRQTDPDVEHQTPVDNSLKYTTSTSSLSDKEVNNVDVKINYNEDFEHLYPKPKQKGCEMIYYIDLTKPTEIVESKPFDIFGPRRIVPQPKKYINGPMVTVGGGWNTQDYYMERHIPVKKFEYKKGHGDKFYGFRSHYKKPRANRTYRPL